MKEVELKLISELMKNSRRSDRDLAKVIGVSQPTVSRLIKKLEREGIIKGYTMIPDFQRIGFELLGLTFARLRKTLGAVEIDKARETAKQYARESRFAMIMLERGIGLGHDGVIISFYKDYSDYIEHKKELGQFQFLELSEADSFLINLNDTVHYLPLTLVHMADHIPKTDTREKGKKARIRE